MELECDLSKINNEELLRKMWQQSEDASRKKEIRSQLYKLRESRLRDLYQGDIMADNSVAGFGKDPLATSHGDALADQSFQSLKSKEIRDSLSPTEMKFQSMALNNPNTTGWDVQSSKEVSPDGKGFRAETVATTDGVESINGGIAEFKGRNEQRSSAHHQGDDKNFVKKAMESSNSHLQEKVVIGDENSGRTEVRTSSSKSTSSSQVFKTSSNVEYDDGFPQPQRYLMDANRPHAHPQDLQQRQQQEQQRLLEEQRMYEQQFQQQRQQHHNQQERRTSEQLSSTRQNTEQKNISQNVQTQETHEQNKRYVDMDKASPEYQQHVQHLMQQDGEIISNTVEYPKPNVKMITTVKRLPDGTIVRNKRYETEEMPSPTPSTRTTSTPTNQTQPRRDSQQQPTRNYQPDSAPHSRPSQDMVDSSNTSRYVQDTHTDDVETKFSSIKKSSSKYSTESTSETIQEFDDRHPHGVKPVTNDFSTHGFPSVRSNKPTQEYPGERPHTARPTQGFPSQAGPSRPSEAVVPHYTDATDNISERRVPTKDGEVIIVSSEKKRNYKTSSNSERIVETEQVIRDDQPYQQITDKSGFPTSQQPKNYPSERQMQPHEQDFPLDKLPPGTRIIKTTHSPHVDDDVVVVSSQKSHTAKHSTNTERVIEHEIVRDDQPGGYPRIQPHTDNSPYNYTVTTPGEQMPNQGFPSVRTPGHAAPGDREPYGDYPAGTSKPTGNDYTTQGFPSVKPTSRPAAGLPSNHNQQHPGSPRKSPSHDYSTQGFPSVRSPNKGTPTQGYPSNVDAGRPNGHAEQPRGTPTKSQPRAPSPNKYKAPNTTVRETTERVIRKEKEVDSAHRAFAASLRSSSPIVDNVRRDSYTTDSHTRHTPRSSVSSTKTFRRDMREGSHDSAPSETSRISTTTVTRNTPPRTVGGKTVVTKVVTTKTGPGANDTLTVTSPRATKSPSPGKTVTTTTTTTRTLTSKDVPKATDNQHTRITTNNIDTLFFPINEPPPPPLTAITKLKFSDNHKQPHKKTKTNISNKKNMLVTNATKNPNASAVLEEVIEEPCIKKHYYKLGPSDQQSNHDATSQPLKSPQIYEKSPTKKPQPQPAPSSRSSTPSYSSRKPPTSAMTDDYDDADKLNTTTSPLSPSSRSRTPQKIAPNDNDNDNDKPQDDWQTRPQPDNDERRTVNRETTFEKNQTENLPSQPRRPNYEQPNVEWIIVDDVDDYDDHDDDNDSFAPEVVDSKLNVKKTTTKLITQEKQTPVAPQRRPKSTTTTTVTTKQFHTIPSKLQTKPSDKSPLKTKPNDSRTPQQLRPQKPLTDSRSPVRTPLKSQPKVMDNKPLTKGPKSTAPSYTSPLRKPLPKSTTEETTLRKTLKTTTQVVKDKTNKLIESEKLKRKPQSPERRTKPQTPAYRKPNGVEQQETEIVVTEITEKRLPQKPQDTDDEPIYGTPYETDDEPMQGRPSYRKPKGTDDELTPGYRRPLDTDDEPIEGRPSNKKPQGIDDEQRPDYRRPLDTDDEPHQGSPNYRKPYGTDDEPHQESPSFRKPQDIDDEPYFGAPGNRKPQGSPDEPMQGSPGYKTPQETDEKPKHGTPGFNKPQQTFDEPKQGTPGFRKPLGTADEPHKSSPGYRKPVSPGFRKLQNTFDERSPDYRKPQATDNEPHQGSPNFRKPQGTNDEPHYSTPGHTKPQDNDDEPKNVMPGYEKPQTIVEQQITITETSENVYPQREAPKRPYKPHDTDYEPNQGSPTAYRKPQDTGYEPDYRKPHDSDFEPNQHTPGYRQPHDTNEEPHKGSPGYRQPLNTDNKPHPSTPGFIKPRDTNEEDLPHYRNPHQVSEHEIITTETMQIRIPDKETPQSPDSKPGQRTPASRKPYDIDDEPNQGKPRTPGHFKPTETDEESGTPTGYRKQPQTKPKYIKPSETDDDECFTETESIITTSNKTVAKHIQKFETNHLSNKSPKPQKRTKSPTKELPQTQKKSPRTPSKETSPTRTQKKPETQPKIGKPRSDKPFETDEDETFVETNEFVINSTQKRIVSEKQILEEEHTYPGKKPQKPGHRVVSPTRKPGQKFPGEPTDKYPKSPKSSVSPTRTQRKPEYPEDTPRNKPLDTDDDETVVETREFIINSTQKHVVNEKQILEFEDTKTTRGISPTGKRPQSPNKHVSPTRLQKKPEQKSPLKPTDGRPKSPNKHVSPTRIQKSPNEKTPLDDETYTTTLKTTRIVREQITKELDDEKYPENKPKDRKPLTGKPLDTDDDETVIETSEFVTNSTQKRVVSEKHISVFEEPDKKAIKKMPDTKTPTREIAPTQKKPGQKQPEQPTGKRSQSPTKPVSPTRTQKPLKPHQMPTVDDQTFRKTLRTSETVTEKLTKNVDDGKDYPVEKIPTKKGDKPEKKPKAGKPYSEQPSDTDEDETITETCEFVTNTTQKRIVTEQEILEFEAPRFPDNETPKTERVSKSPIRGHSPTRQQRQPDEKQPGDRLKEPTGRRPQSPNKPTSYEKKPQSTDKRPKHVSPTRTQKKPNEKLPLEDDDTFSTSYTTTKVVKQQVTKDVDQPKGRKPQSVRPFDSDEDEPVVETTEFVINSTQKRIVSEKQILEFEEPSYPDKKIPKKKPEKDSPSSPRGVSPTRTQKRPGQKSPEEPGLKEPTDKRPQSPTKHVSPTRNQRKPVDEDETFSTSLRTTKTVTEKTTKKVDEEEYPEKTPNKKGDKPETKPKARKPSDTDEDETVTETSERYISSKTCMVTEKLTQEFEKPVSPTRGVSPTRTQKKPGQKLPEEPADKRPKSPTRTQKKPGQQIPEEPTDKRPKSPTRNQKKPGQQIPEEPSGKRPQSPNKPTDEEIFKTSLRTTKTVTEKYPDKRAGDKPDTKPKERKPHSDKPGDSDDDETFNSKHVISSKTQVVSEKLIQEFEEPKSPTRGVSPTRIQKKPVQKPSEEPDFKKPIGKRPQSPTRTPKKPSDDEEIFKTTSRTIKTVTEKTTKYVDDEEYPDETTPYRKGEKPQTKPKERKPYSDKPCDTDEEETLTETSERFISSKTHVVTENLIQEFEGPESPKRGISPTRTQKKPGQKPDLKEPTGKRPLSPSRPKERKPYSDKPCDTDEEETLTETSERFISSKTRMVTENVIQEFEGPESPKRGVSPTRTQKKPGQKLPQEPGLKGPTGKRPLSPSRTHKKPTNEDETFQTTLRTTKTVTEKTTKKVEDEEYPDKRSPYKTGDKPETKPKKHKPYSDKPSDTDEDETLTETSERYISSKTCMVTEEINQEFDKPKSPARDVSPTQTQNRPKQNLPKEFGLNEPTGKRPQSPTRTTRIVKENVTKTFETEQFPEQEKPDKKPRQPGFVEPIEKRPKSPNKHVSPTRNQVVFEDDQTLRKTLRTTQIATEEPKQFKPKSYKPTETDGDETFMETTEFVTKTIQKPKYPGSQEPDKQSLVQKLQPKYIRPGFEDIEDHETFTHTSEFVRNTAQKLITTEKQTIEMEKELLKPSTKRPIAPKGSPSSPTKERSPARSPSPKQTVSAPIKTPRSPKDRKDSPTRSPSSKEPKSAPKSITIDDETFRKTLRTTEIFNDKTKPKERKPGQEMPTDTDEEETTTETEEFLIETCEKRYVTERNITSEEENQKLSTTLVKPNEKKPHDKEPFNKPKPQQPSDNKPDNEKPVNKPFTTTYVETMETIEDQTYPEDTEQFTVSSKFPDNQKPYTVPLEPWITKNVPRDTKNFNEKFIETERVRKETPDGAFVSKTTEPTTPTSPTFKKKGAGRRDTFEERCRQILGMETYGDTPGTFKKQPITEIEEKKTVVTKEVKTTQDDDINTTVVFQVKIEDCDEDDEPLSISSVKKTLHKQIHTKEPLREEPKTVKKPVDEPKKKPTKPSKEEPEFVGPNEDYTDVTKTKKPVGKTEFPKDDEKKFVSTITKTTTIHKKSPKTKTGSDTEPDSSETETIEEQCVVVNKETKKSEVKITKKSSPSSTPRAVSPTKSTTSSRSVSPTKPKSSTPRNVSPLKETPKRKPSKDSLEPKTNKTSPQKPENETTTTIKDRLRSSTRKTKSPSKHDQVDGSESSPEHSPTRYNTERRRSSNISVTTEIIIEHTDSDTPHKKEKSPVPVVKKPKDSVFRDIIDSTVMPEKLTRRMPVTERKESAPVHRVTNRDKDSKMSRSTSENLIKVKKPEPHSLSPKGTPKTTDHRRPNKCFATKSINLSATDRLVNSTDMENVIIDIQHAKSSREPSPDKIVPTPVPAHMDTGKPRYPDVVQEPEDDQPRRKPQVKNIPIFEEENNAYVGCHITEVNMERTHKTTYDSLDYEEQILNNPVVEAPASLDYPSLEKPTYDESLLTVHEKVSKFQNIAEELNKPKASEPFQREFDDSYKVPQNDEFVKTSTLKTNEEDDEDEEFARNERIYTTVKLAPTAPQKSPELVRTISRHISRQNEPDSIEQQPGYYNEDYPLTSRNDDFVECLVDNKKITKEFEVSHQQHQQLKQQSTIKTAEKYQQPKQHDDDHDDDELIPHTKTHTNIIEERRQKDILSRPSVFDGRNKKPTTSTTTKTPLQCNKSPVKDSEKLRPDIKSRTKPTSAVTNTLTETTTATTTANKPKQSPQRKNSDIDYELRGSGVETGVRNIISKQTKVYNNNSSGISSTKPNDLKKPTTSNKNKPEKHMPVRLTPAKNSDEHDLSADEYDDNEMIITVHAETTDIYDIETQVVNEDLNKETTTRKIPLTTPHKQQPTTHSSTNSSPTDQPLKIKTKEHVEKLTDSRPLKSNTVTTTTSIKTDERADDIDETVLVEPASKKKTTKPTKMSTTTTDSVAARRSLFESNNSSPSATPTKRTPMTSPLSVRRPSYMDHTKSSLEHTRRDSLEINKTNYSRKPSHPEEEVPGFDRNSMVKFDVPQGKRATTPRATSVTEDINVEEIFELEVLERLLETVQSYEIRRRIRAQIRLIKKNQKNELITSSTEVITKTIKTSKVGSEEPDTVTTTTTTRKTKPDSKTTTQTVTKDGASHISSSKKEYIFEEAYMPTSRRSPKPNRYPYEVEKEPEHKPTRSQSPVCRRNAEHERQYERSHHSPEHEYYSQEVREHVSHTTKQQHYYKHEQEQEHMQEIRHETSPSRKSPSHSIHSSPERRNASPESHKPLRTNERSRSPQTKAPQSTRVTSSRSPDSKTSTVRKSSATYEQQQETLKTSSSTKPQTKRITTTTTTTTNTKSKPEDKTPVWADRKNILKTPSSTAQPKKPSSTTLDSRAGYTKTVKSATSQKMTSHKSSFVDDDCVTSSYGIGPTDENGLPLFGIRALKKKKPTVEPSETTEEVTGYVVEEKYYSDSKTKPKVERKEFIYSTNPEELQKLKEQVEVTTNRKALKDVEVKETRQTALISKATPALRSSPEDDFLDSSTKYVRRGSVKEMSEKFIQREASSAVTEKSNNYPKAGLILRTNSRKNSRDAENDNENFESYKTTRVQHHTSTVLADSDDAEQEYEVEEVGSRHSGRFITESESECDSIKTQREFKKVTSSSSSSMATRSFLNTQGEEKVITNVSECLERMRNADNVVEEGDTAEDQEARALLNKFLGASIIMKGVESSLPAAANRQSKIITTTTTSSNLSDDNDGDNNAKHEVKTTRITKTIKSGSSSTPVTYTTCAIEEIWDEEILKELLEQARTYEERRKIRSRLRELMADREETKQSPNGEGTAKAAANVPAEEESSASEYEEIIEEVTVTDYSEAESDVDDNKNETDKVVAVVVEKSQKDQQQTSEAALVTKTEEKSVTSVTAKSEVTCTKQETHTEQIEESTTTTATATVTETVEEEEVVEETASSKDGDTTDSSEKGESLKPMVHDKQKTPQTMPQEGNSSHSNQSTNSQKLKSAQTSSNSKTTGSESSSMHAPYSKNININNNNNINNKTQKTTSTAPTSSQNPIVTVQTAGRADSTSISSKTNTKNNSSRQTHSNNSNIDINSQDNGNNVSSSSVGGNSVAVGSSDSPRQVDRLGVPQKEDSGTESGEDLRLIAAGLRDQLQIQSDSNIIEDVTGALSRLENSLKEGKDISVDTEKRKALLALVERLRAGLTSPEKLAEIAAAMSELDGNEGLYGETSSPEADAHRSNRSRFAKRRNRVNRHTVGVSREELADARRYMEDMLIMGNISQSTTPEANAVHNNTPPQWYPLEKNASSGAILTQTSTPVLQRPKQFVPTDAGANTTYTDRLTVNNGKRRPLSGEYSVTFGNPTVYRQPEEPKESPQAVKQSTPPDDSSKFSRFTNKKHLMKRANTIDLAKTHKYNSEFDTDSDAEDKGPHLGLKRAVQVSVKKRVQNVVPPFEPKTENDRKFLAFINKQSDKPGLGWTSSRSVSNWTNKFGSIKSTFEGGLAGKPPQAPHHVSSSAKPQQSSKLFSPPNVNNSAPNPAANYITNQQIAMRLQQEAERQAEERRRKLERERLEFERRERDQLERQRQQRERQERERLEREHFERQRREQDQIAAAQHAAILREQEQLAAAQQAAASMNVPKPIPINEFKHAPQSVFRPIDNVDSPSKPIYKPIPQLPRNSSNWQSLNATPPRGQGNSLNATSPSQYGKPDNSFITSPPPSSRSPIALPWASKPTVDSSGFKSKANRFEERSKYDNIHSAGPFVQRHNSLRSSNGASHQFSEDFRKRPSLPNTCDPYSVRQMPTHQDPLAHLPPPQNISFTYSNLKPKTTYQSYPCLPSAVVNNSSDNEYQRSREDSLTDPHAVPLVLTSSNPLYCPTTPPQQQQQQLRLPRQFDLVSPADSAPTSPSIYTMPQTDCTDDDLDSDNNLLEYHAVSRVMGKPQSQTAVTVGRRTGHVSDDELFGKNSRAAKNLLSTMKSIGNPNGMAKPKAPVTKRPEAINSPKQCLSPDGRSYQAPIVEPLFPEINKFEANRKPTYNDENNKQTTAPTYPQPAPRKPLGMYKSMENLNRSTNKTQSNFKATTIQQPSPKPYVSETQTSYVVTYPIEDNTDDEDFSRLGQNKMMPPKSLDLRRQRNVSENSTGSSTTASMSYSQNLPSPNTSWTSNPIVVDESSNYQNMPAPYQNPNKNVPPSPVEPTYQALSSQVVTSYSSVNPNLNYNPPPSDYIKTAAQYEAPSQRSMTAQQQMAAQYETPPQRSMPAQQQMAAQYETPPQRSMPSMTTQQQMAAQYETPPQRSMPAQQQMAAQYETPPQRSMPSMTTQQQMAAQYDAPPQRQMLSMPAQQQAPVPIHLPTKQQNSMPTTKSSYEAKSQRQLQQMQSTTNQKQTTTKSSHGAQTQQPIQQQAPERMQKPPVTQKPTDYPKQSPKTTTKTTTTTTQEKRSLASLRKTVSEDHHSGQVEQTVINPQHSNISQEMISRLDQQRERISNDIRRKSLGNALDYQMEKQARFETQHSEEYKSSAPENTPDIVKSSLPKDENQPILKKFGPPQRHHYMPNSYQSPGANTTSTSVVSTSTHSSKMQGKDVHSTSNHTVMQTSQQIFNNTRPTVMETPATPQPDDDYIPRNIVFNNVHAFTSMNRHQESESVTSAQEQHQANRPNKLSKSDSWNQIMMLQKQHVPTHTTKFNQSPTNELRRTKSGHTLALPKMYEAAMTKTDISEKQKTVAAYFSGQKSPTQQETVVEQQTTKRSVINRTKTSEKVSAASRKSLGSNLPIAPGGLQRSATMPHIASLNLLDESNVEDAFEQLMMEQKQQKSSTSTTEKTETKDKDGAVVTTTTKVTTRTVTGSAAKPVSPFNKFKQLDRQNSQQSAKSPTTPTTPGGGSTASPSSGNQPIFRFTDPALNAKAATVKEQLLQWCQSKTQEYENIEITNFSTSWNNGLAFCALIHHFLPDAFDYSQLTPKNRRKNFELAFTVADEKAGIAPLLDVEDMVVMQRPDWKCVFVYVQSIYRRFRNCQ